MMADQFGLTDNMYLSDAQRGLAADLSRAFDNSREVQERSMARYGLPALSNYEKDWAIERARSMADRTNRMRMARTSSYGTGSYGNGARAPNTQSGQRTSIGGIMQFLPLLLGKKGMFELERDGAIKYVKDAWGNLTAQPGENYREWLDKNSFTTAEGNTAIVGEDGNLRIVNPNTGELLENVNNSEWSYDNDGNVDFNSAVFGADNTYTDTSTSNDGNYGNYGGGGYTDTSTSNDGNYGNYGGGGYTDTSTSNDSSWDWSGDSGGGETWWGW